MNFIVFDLEATCWEHPPPGVVQEIIEIGALKLNPFGDLKASFHTMVKPKVFPKLSVFCRQLTKIPQEEIDRAPVFIKAIEHFQDWIDIYEEEYLLCSWGKADRRLLTDDCGLHRLDNDWLDPYIDLKAQYADIKGLLSPIGLKQALTREGFEFTGDHHRAYDDAENLAKIFVRHIDEWRY